MGETIARIGVKWSRCAWAALGGALLTLTLLPVPSFGAESRAPESFIKTALTTPPTEVTLASPGGIAIDESTGNVFLAHGSGAAGSSVFITGSQGDVDSKGTSPVGLVQPYQLTGFNFGLENNGVAFDNSPTSPNKGTLYVVTSGGSAAVLKIKKFTRNLLTEKFEPAGELTATRPTAPGSFGFTAGSPSSSVTVDDDGNLFVGEFTCRCVIKFDPAGIQVGLYTWIAFSFNPRPSGGLAVDTAGNVFMSSGGNVYTFPDTGSGISPWEVINTPLTAISTSGTSTSLALDRDSDELGPDKSVLYIALGNRVAQYDVTNPTAPIIEFEFGMDQLVTTTRVAVNAATNLIYVSDTGTGKDNVAVFGPPIVLPEATTKSASGVTGTTAILNGAVNPQGNEITECKFEYGPTAAYGFTVPCSEAIFTDSSDHAVSAEIGDLEPNGTIYNYRLVVDSVNGEASPQGANRTFITDDTVFTEPATAVTDTSATLNGIVWPEGEQLTECKFEYGTALDYGLTVPCSPSAGAISDDFDPHAVTGTLTNLDPNTTYHVRLSASNADETAFGVDRTFTTFGPPRVVEQRPLNATENGVTLQARIDPSGSSTAYHFEFGADITYGARIPVDHDLVIGSGTEPVTVTALRSGLQKESVYWFRVVATNARGTTVGPDQRLETLNEHGLPSSRAFELVTTIDKGPAGSVASDLGGQQFNQASLVGDSIIWPFTNGNKESTSGGPLRMRAGRTESGWVSGQVSAPSLIAPPRKESLDFAYPSRFRFSSAENSCGFVETYNPLTPDTTQANIELGLTNLYRWSADDSHQEIAYELVTDRLPLNPDANPPSDGYFTTVDASDDCSRVFFRSEYEFIAGASGLYEWDEGTLRDAGVLPDTGEPGDDNLGLTGRAVLGGEINTLGTARWNAVSPDGSRVFFTAISSSGKPAVFMREDDGASIVEVSESETGVATNGARFEAASADGGRVFFRANYGIDDDATSAGPTGQICGPRGSGIWGIETEFDFSPKLEKKPCDLYVYDIESEELTDLSAESDAPGAQIQGTVAIDEDGSRVYFAALGQLVPGKGRTYAENTAGFGSANVYLARLDEDGELSELEYVTTLAEHGPLPNGNLTGDLLGASGNGGAALMHRAEAWAASTTPDGDKLTFVSSLNLGEWDSGGIGKYAVYLYSAGTERLICVSCRPDGLPSVASALQSALLFSPPERGYRAPSISEDGSRIFFTSPDVLALGAISSKLNVYEWHQGQVSLLAVAEGGGLKGLSGYRGASINGRDVFVATGDALVGQDTDSLSDIYDLREGGGFVEPPPPPPPCQVDESVSLITNQIYCQGDRTPQPSVPPVGSKEPRLVPPVDDGAKCDKGKIPHRGRCLTAAQLARERCRKVSGKEAKRRCVRKQMQQLIRSGHNRGGAK